MFLNKKTILIFILVILILFLYIKLKNKEKFQNFSPEEMAIVSNILTRLTNKEQIKRNIVNDINKNVIDNANICFDDNNCFDDILTTQNTYLKNNYYEIPNFTAKEINTNRLCFKNNCIDIDTINSLKTNNLFDRLRQYYLFDINNAIIYPHLDNNDVSGNFNTIIDICGNNGTIPILIDSNFVSPNTLTTAKQRPLFKTALVSPAVAQKLPFNDAFSKYGYKLTPQNMAYYDTSGFLIKIPNQYSNINFNVLWLNVTNYVFSTFQVCLYNISTKQIIKKYGVFGTGLKLENKFDDNFNFTTINDLSGNYFDWVPVPIYGNDNSDNNQRLVVSVDRSQSAGTAQTDISGFIITGIGFSTNPYNYCRINPATIYYNSSNQKSDFFGGTTYVGFDSQTKTALNFNKQLGNTVADIRTVKINDISGISISSPSTMFSMQILPPRENNYKIIYLIGKTNNDLTGLKISISIRTGQEYLIDNLVDISNYPPFSLTSLPNIKGVIINPSIYQFGEYFNVIKIILPSGARERNILEVGSFDVNKNLVV